jgi:hypothetical protein
MANQEQDVKCTDHDEKRPTKTSLKEYRAWSSHCVNQVQDGTVMGYIKGMLSDYQLLQKDCALQCWSFNYIRIEMLGEEKPLRLIHHIGFRYHCCLTFLCGRVPAVTVFIVVLNWQQQFVTSVLTN